MYIHNIKYFKYFKIKFRKINVHILLRNSAKLIITVGIDE